MALFCHGGVWAHGERWHYAPMATRLAQAGVLTMVMSYSLYPKASAAMQAAELNQALSWSLSNVDKYGGDPAKVSDLRLNCPLKLTGSSAFTACVPTAARSPERFDCLAGFSDRAFGRCPPVCDGTVAQGSERTAD